MSRLKLIYFEGCPKIDFARKNLQMAGYLYDEIRQDNLPEGHPLKDYTSPTLLKGERVIFGTLSSSGQGGCSLEIPTAEQIKTQIEKAD
jgi:hypothetical protein